MTKLTNEQKLKKLMSLMDEESLTKEDFLKSFEGVIKQVLKAEQQLSIRIEDKTKSANNTLKELQEKHKEEIKKIKEENSSTLSNIKKWVISQVNSLFIKSKINEKLTGLFNLHNDKIKEIDDRISSMRDDDELEENILNNILSKIPKQEHETAEVHRDLLESLKEDERLDWTAIRGLKEELERAKATGSSLGGYNVLFRTLKNITPEGTIDGSNTTFTLPKAPKTDKEQVFLNGIRLRKGADNDYTLENRTVTFNDAPITGSILLVDLEY